MVLQNVFYIMSIIFMSLQALILIILIIILLFIQHMIKDLHSSLKDLLDKGKRVTDNPGEVAAQVGAAMAGKAIDKMTEIVSKQASH